MTRSRRTLPVPVAVLLAGLLLTLPALNADRAGASPLRPPAAVLPAPDAGVTPAAAVPPEPATRTTAADTLLFGAVGDMMLGSWLTPLLDSLGVDYPLTAVTPLLARADLLLGNLEAPFLADTTGMARAEKTYTFAVPPRHLGVLSAAGFDVVTLANNHILDFGPAGLDTTRTLLEEAGIAHAGTGADRSAAHRHVLVERAGRRVAVLAYNHVFPEDFWAGPDRPGTAHADDAGLAREVARAAAEAEIVVVTFHWGAEGMETPKDYQRILARIAIDNGADLVVGHHPHVLQPLEWYRGRLIAYSLGNFVFASYSETPTGAVLLVRFEGEVPIAAEFHPLDVNNLRRAFRPVPVPAARWPRLGSAVVAALADSAAAGAPGVRIVPEDGFLLLPPIPFPSP